MIKSTTIKLIGWYLFQFDQVGVGGLYQLEVLVTILGKLLSPRSDRLDGVMGLPNAANAPIDEVKVEVSATLFKDYGAKVLNRLSISNVWLMVIPGNLKKKLGKDLT